MDVLVVLLVLVWSSELQAQENSNTEPDFMLAGGAHRCEGRLRVKKDGAWVGVRPDGWSLLDANQLCLRLGCGSAASAEEVDWHTFDPVLYVERDCVWRGEPLSDCITKNDLSMTFLEIKCSESVRLVSDSGLCSGRLEVRPTQYNQSWSAVCHSGFDQQDAAVVCRELGCGPPLVLRGAPHEDGDPPVLSREFGCQGKESALLSCESSDATPSSCSAGRAVELACTEMRLGGGRNRCAGTVELRYKRGWKPVNYMMTPRNIFEADVVCRKIDCGTALSSEERMGRSKSHVGIPADWLTSANHLRERAVKKHHYFFSFWHVTCADSVRLVNGSNLCSGRLQVRSAQFPQSWSTVCESNFDQQDAEVVCWEIGCGPPSALRGGLYGEAGGPRWPREFHCEGSEPGLLSCKSGNASRDACSPGEAVGLTCSEPVRFVGGASRCEGRVELRLEGQWRPMGEGAVTMKEAPLICERLGCGSALSVASVSGAVYGVAWLAWIPWIRAGYSLRESAIMAGWSTIVELKCAQSTRVVNGPNLCSGRVEVKVDQSWLPVCESDFDQRDAEVACRDIDCGAPSQLQGGLFGEAEGPMYPKEFHCGGSESSLQRCESSNSSRKSCPPGKAVGLTCSENIRLVRGPNRCAGRVDVKSGIWRPIFIAYSDWTLRDVRRLCTMVDCGSAVSHRITRYETSPIWRTDHECIRAGSSVRECLRGTEDSAYTTEITCLENLRLANSSRLCSGRLEMKSNRLWLPVSEDDFDRRDAEVVCRVLGCGPPAVLQGGLYGQGDGPMWPTTYHCGGHEASLLNCESSESTRDTNLPGRAIGLRCSEPIRLVGGSNRCAGVLEVKHEGEWTPVGGPRTRELQEQICRDLGCGSLLTSENGQFISMVFADHNCLNDGFPVRECVSSSGQSNAVNITCSGHVTK